MESVFLTGADGFLGSNLVQRGSCIDWIKIKRDVISGRYLFPPKRKSNCILHLSENKKVSRRILQKEVNRQIREIKNFLDLGLTVLYPLSAVCLDSHDSAYRSLKLSVYRRFRDDENFISFVIPPMVDGNSQVSKMIRILTIFPLINFACGSSIKFKVSTVQSVIDFMIDLTAEPILREKKEIAIACMPRLVSECSLEKLVGDGTDCSCAFVGYWFDLLFKNTLPFKRLMTRIYSWDRIT